MQAAASRPGTPCRVRRVHRAPARTPPDLHEPLLLVGHHLINTFGTLAGRVQEEEQMPAVGAQRTLGA